MEVIRRKDGSIRYREKVYIGGKAVKSRSFRRKGDAKAWKREQLNERDRLEALGFSYQADVTLQKYSETFLWNKEGHAPRTIEAYQTSLRLYILPELGNIKLRNLKLQHGENLKRTLYKKGSLSNTRINHILNLLKVIAKDAVKNDYLIKSPFHNLEFLPEQKRQIDYWLPEEIGRFLRANSEDKFLPLYTVALNTGLRKGELLGLCWDCVKFSDRQIVVARNMTRHGLQENTKGNKVRYIPMNEPTYNALKTLESEKKSLKFVFAKDDGSPVDYQHIAYREFRKAIKRAGVRKIRFHDLRSTFASCFCMNGGNLYALSKILGHSSIKITEENYAHLHPDYIEGQANVVNFSVDTGQANLRSV